MRNAKSLVFALALTGASIVQATLVQDAPIVPAETQSAWADPIEVKELRQTLKAFGDAQRLSEQFLQLLQKRSDEKSTQTVAAFLIANSHLFDDSPEPATVARIPFVLFK